jgi:hypothetical protein
MLGGSADEPASLCHKAVEITLAWTTGVGFAALQGYFFSLFGWYFKRVLSGLRQQPNVRRVTVVKYGD